MREAYTDQNGMNAFGTATGVVADADRLNNLRRAIDSIEQRLNATSGGGHFAGNPADIAAMQEQINRLSQEIGVVTSPNATPEDIQALDTTGVPEFDAVAADIMRRQQALNNQDTSSTALKVAHAQQHAQQQAQLHAQQQTQQLSLQQAQQEMRKQAKKQADDLAKQQKAAMGQIAKQFEDLKHELAALKQDVAKPITVQPKLESNELRRIAEKLSGMQKAPVLDDKAFSRLSDELAHLRLTMKEDLQKEMSVTHDIQTRLDNLTLGVDAMATQTGNTIGPRVDNLFVQVDTLRRTIDDLPQTLSISRLDDRLGEMVQKLDAIPVDLPEAATTDLTSVESRLDEISRGLVAVSNMGSRMPKLDLSAIDRLEQRFEELSKTVDGMATSDERSVESAELQELTRRIEGLTDRLGSFEQYAEQGDMGAASALFAAPDTGMIEEQLKTLTARLDEASAVNSTAAQISNLEAQIGKILRAMEKAPEAAAIDFTPVESRLGQIEDALVSTQQFSMEAAQQAAQQAVALVGTQSDAGQIVTALSDDLQALQTITESGNEQNVQMMSDVSSALNKIVDRLGSIEGSAVANSAPAPQQTATRTARAANIQVNATTGETLFVSEPDQPAPAPIRFDEATIDTRVVEAPSIDPVNDIAPVLADEIPAPVPAPAPAPENHQPLEPGDAPNLNALPPAPTLDVTSAAGSLGTSNGSEPSMLDGAVRDDVATADNAKPDPIGAARRALQATTAEINAVRDDVSEDKKDEKSSGSSLKAKLDGVSLKKPLIIAAAATLLLVLANFGYKKFVAGSGDSIASKATPAIEKTVATPETGSDATVMNAEETKAAMPPVSMEEKTGTTRVIGAEPVKPEVETIVATSASSPSAEKIEGNDGVSVAPSTQDEPEVVMAKPEPGVKKAEQVAIVSQPEAKQETVVPAPAFNVPAGIGPQALVKAASGGDPKALFEIGMRYSDGKSVKRDMVASAQWFERSAEAGYAPAQYSIGSLYEKGIGVKKSVATATSWYEKAATQGNARAMHNLAVINAMGNDGEPDMTTAVKWFNQAAGFGIKDSQFNLGILYGQGMGVPQNLKNSYKWFALAAKTGDTDATAKRDEVAKAMDPTELEAARAEVAAWKPAKLVDAVNRVKVPKEWRSKATAKLSGAAAVKKVQALLNERGFSVGTPDGVMGPNTKKAVMEFQRSAGLPVTGTVDKRLLGALGVSG